MMLQVALKDIGQLMYIVLSICRPLLRPNGSSKNGSNHTDPR
jgi:hypothetical protein